MLVTLTSKGQLTLPKRIRDELKLEAGAKLDFSVQSDGTLSARPLHRSVSAIVGLLHRPERAPASVAQLNKARDAYLGEKHPRAGAPTPGVKAAPLVTRKRSRP